jgi:hypothetical protein
VTFWITDPWQWGGAQPYASEVTEQEKPTLLGPDGKPIQSPQRRIGFDLTPKGAVKK